MDVISLLRDCDPAAGQDVPGPDSAVGRLIRRGVLEQGAGSGSFGRVRPQRRMPKGFPVATALVFALTIGVLLTLVYTSGSGPASVPTPKVVKALERLASIAGRQPPLPAGRYYYTDIENVNTQSSSPTFSANTLGIQQSWISANGSAVQSTTQLRDPHFYTAADREAWVKAGRPNVATPPFQTVQRFSASTPGVPPLYDVSGLPVDPASLYKILDRESPGEIVEGKLPKGISELDLQGSCNGPACALLERTTALIQGPDEGSTPAFRAALFEVLAMVPHLQYLGTVRDPIGQSGTGFRFVDSTPARTEYYSCKLYTIEPNIFPGATKFRMPASSVTYTVVINPRTSAFMSQEETYQPFLQSHGGLFKCVSPGTRGRPGTDQRPQEMLPNFDVLLKSGVVDSVPRSVAAGS